MSKFLKCSLVVVVLSVLLLTETGFLIWANLVWKLLNFLDGTTDEMRVNQFVGTPHEDEWKPVSFEKSIYNLEIVKGQIPKEMTGIFMRIGPNPLKQTRGAYHIFEGDGMIHSFSFNPFNQSVHYTNAFMKTPKLQQDMQSNDPTTKFGPSLYDVMNIDVKSKNGIISLIKVLFTSFLNTNRFSPFNFIRKQYANDRRYWNCANTNIVQFRDKIYATCEASVFFEISVDIKTDFAMQSIGFTELNKNWSQNEIDNGLKFPFIAHPKIDLETDEMMVSGHFFDFGAIAKVGIFDKNFELKGQSLIDLNHAQEFHDMAFTKNYIIIFDMNIWWGIDQISNPEIRKFQHFETNNKSRIGVIERKKLKNMMSHQNKVEVQWFDIEPCQMWHVGASWESEDGNEIVIIGGRFSYFDINQWSNYKSNTGPFLYEWKLDLKNGKVREEEVTKGYKVEMPVIHPLFDGYKTDYIFFSLFDFSDEAYGLASIGIVKYDTNAKRVVGQIRFGNNETGSPQCVFVPKQTFSKKSVVDHDDGYLVNIIYDRSLNQSTVKIWDAKNMQNEPMTVIGVPHMIPGGFHSKYILSHLLY